MTDLDPSPALAPAHRPGPAPGQDARYLPPGLLRRDLGGGRTLRLADPGEFAEVGAVLQAAFTDGCWVTPWYHDHLAEIAPRSVVAHVWVVADARGVLGAVLTPKPQYHAEEAFTFNILGVGPRGRGLGLGRELVDHSVALARALGHRWVEIRSSPQMTAAHRLYYRYGFVRRPERETAIVDSGQRLFAFSYRITDPARRPPIPVEAPPSQRSHDPVPEEDHDVTLSHLRPPGDLDPTGEFHPTPPQHPGRPTLAPGTTYRLVTAPDALRGRAALIARRLAGAEQLIEVIPDPAATSPLLQDVHGEVVSDDWRRLPRTILAGTTAGRELYPPGLQDEVDLLDLLIRTDLVGGLERAIFSESEEAALVARRSVYARLGELDRRLLTRRQLLGDRITAADITLFAVLLGFDLEYRRHLGWGAASLVDHPALWAYARRLLRRPGFATEAELVDVGLLPTADGGYAAPWGTPPPVEGVADLRAAWFDGDEQDDRATYDRDDRDEPDEPDEHDGDKNDQDDEHDRAARR